MDQRANEISKLPFAFPEIPLFETERLILREVRTEHLLYLVNKAPANLARQFMGIRTDAEWTNEKLRSVETSKNFGTGFCRFYLYEKKSGMLIGAAGFHNWILLHRRAEIGYALIDDRWKRQGFMTEVLQFILPFGFHELNLHRIEACVGPFNDASNKLVLNFGFQREGYMREHYYREGIHEDSILYSLLKPDFEKAYPCMP